ncbi:ABC transporter permease subunit [Curtobacterium sp. A7_M15]|uniref:ABC transporter permease n=1 Tax=Curtobacterium sp. A7_M15 TaxID=3065241 RepID=UPI002737EDB1|nr:ABC transporter permease subunit [Curtobacterium sp. A7_M15]MDP4332721.1 ABC transporter permease subunit [Curtobacterium sp. A7_M15]
MSATMVDPTTESRTVRSDGVPVARKVPFTARLRRDYPLLVMVAPAVVLLLLFVYVPMLGNVIAFMDYQPYIPIAQSPWVGLSNFQVLFVDPDFWRATLNTLEITFIQLVLFFPVPIALALLIHSLVWPWLRATVQSVLYLPHFLSWVIVVGFFQQSLGSGGVVNHALRQLDVGTISVMSDPGTFKLLLTSQVIWKDAGWGTIIFLAALAAIDDNLYEAAAIDGSGAWSRFWHVTLPGIRPIIVLLLILRLGEALSVGFEQIILQRNAVGADAAEVLDTYVYYHGVVDGNWSAGIAVGLIKGLVGFVLIMAANKAAHMLGEQGVYSRS